MARCPSRSRDEPAARHLLRIAFGCIWLFDGFLQTQVSMPLGLPSGVLQPAASGSPGWVHSLVGVGVTIWNNHPVPAAAATVWIQAGIGVFLLVAPRGNWSRLAGAASAGWGLLVWVFGEAFGGIFAPGLSWLFGAPGAVIFYVVAGVLIACPDRIWASRRLGRGILAASGVFFVGMAVLQAWPGRGFWQGQVDPHATAGSLASMVQSMAQTPQPGLFSSMVNSFAAFDAAHGWAVNLFVVIALAAIGVAFLTGRRRIVFWGAVAGLVLCLADWVLIEDLGFLGGVGTDPNSMIPMALIFISGYVAMTRLPAPVEVRAQVQVREPATTWRERLAARPAYLFRCLAAVGAIGVVLLGAAPMALAATNPVADPILNEAMDGTPNATNVPAPSFELLDQYGRVVSLASLRGYALVVTFLDPVCTSDCPLIAQELHEADDMLGADSRRARFVAVVTNPIYRSLAVMRAFDDDEGLEHVANWLYLTGSVRQLERTWNDYGIEDQVEPAGSMVAHSEIVYVIDPAGHTRTYSTPTRDLGPWPCNRHSPDSWRARSATCWPGRDPPVVSRGPAPSPRSRLEAGPGRGCRHRAGPRGRRPERRRSTSIVAGACSCSSRRIDDDIGRCLGGPRHGRPRRVREHVLATALSAGGRLPLVPRHPTRLCRQRRHRERRGWQRARERLSGQPADRLLPTRLDRQRRQELGPGRAVEPPRLFARRPRRDFGRTSRGHQWQGGDRRGRGRRRLVHLAGRHHRASTRRHGREELWCESSTAVAFAPGGELLVGASCSIPGRVGVFEQGAAGWHLAGPSPGHDQSGSTVSVLRLRSFDGGVSALIEASSATREVLLGTRLVGDGGWSRPVPPRSRSGRGAQRFWDIGRRRSRRARLGEVRPRCGGSRRRLIVLDRAATPSGADSRHRVRERRGHRCPRRPPQPAHRLPPRCWGFELETLPGNASAYPIWFIELRALP